MAWNKVIVVAKAQRGSNLVQALVPLGRQKRGHREQPQRRRSF